MIPKLLVSNNREEIHKYIDTYIEKFTISPFDIISLGENGGPIKIEQIRDLKQKLGLKPAVGTKKATIIYAAKNLTAEAQNALLKTLEEPPEDTVIILCTPNENLLLPTIVSRCEIQRLNPNIEIRNSKQISNFKFQISNLTKMDIGERFKLAEDLTKKLDKDEALEDIRKRVEKWLAEVIAELHHNLLTGTTREQNAKNLKTFLAAQKQLRQNLNIRLILENCLINLL
jgi:DNA polymerase-3 subunit delta'